MDVIVIARFVVVSFNFLHSEALIPRECEILVLLRSVWVVLEIIFHVALSAHQRTHFLLRNLGDVLALTLKGFNQSRTRNAQVHSLRVVAVGTTNRIHNLVAPSSPVGFIILGDAFFLHHARHVGRFTSPASARLVRAVGGGGRSACTQSSTHILNGMHVSARRGVVPRERISRPQNHHIGALSQNVNSLATVIFRHKRGVGCSSPGVVFALEVGTIAVVAAFLPLKYSLSVVKNTCHLAAPFGKRRNEDAENKHYYHGSAKKAPTLPRFQFLVIHNIVFFYFLFMICCSHSGTGLSGRGTTALGVDANEFLPP